MKRLAVTLRSIFVVLVCMLVIPLGACTPEQVQQDEAYILSLVSSIKAGVKVAAETAHAAADVVCGYMPAVVNDVNTVRDAVGMTGLTPGPKTQAALGAANAAIAAANDLCSSRTQVGATTKVASVWSAYANAKAAIAAAKKASGA